MYFLCPYHSPFSQVTPGLARTGYSLASNNATANALRPDSKTIAVVGENILEYFIPLASYLNYTGPATSAAAQVLPPAQTYVQLNWDGLPGCSDGWVYATSCTAAVCRFNCTLLGTRNTMVKYPKVKNGLGEVVASMVANVTVSQVRGQGRKIAIEWCNPYDD